MIRATIRRRVRNLETEFAAALMPDYPPLTREEVTDIAYARRHLARKDQMLKVYRRIERLERVSGVNDGIPLEHTINFVDSDGTVTGTLVLSHGGPQRATNRPGWEAKKRPYARP